MHSDNPFLSIPQTSVCYRTQDFSDPVVYPNESMSNPVAQTDPYLSLWDRVSPQCNQNLTKMSLIGIITSVILQQCRKNNFGNFPSSEDALDLRTKSESSELLNHFLNLASESRFQGYNVQQRGDEISMDLEQGSRDWHWTPIGSTNLNARATESFDELSDKGADYAVNKFTSLQHSYPASQSFDRRNSELMDSLRKATTSNLSFQTENAFFSNKCPVVSWNPNTDVWNEGLKDGKVITDVPSKAANVNQLTPTNSYVGRYSPPLNFSAFAMDQNMVCPICRKCFRFEKNLLRHLQKTHATGTGESVLKCKLCNYTTRHYSNMYVHIRTHTGDKPYSCSACGVSFTQGSSLKLHIKSRHHDNGNYFSLTRKPGKNNLTKLWTRVLKKDLPKYNSLMMSQQTGSPKEDLSRILFSASRSNTWSTLNPCNSKSFVKIQKSRNYIRQAKFIDMCSSSIFQFPLKDSLQKDYPNSILSTDRLEEDVYSNHELCGVGGITELNPLSDWCEFGGEDKSRNRKDRNTTAEQQAVSSCECKPLLSDQVYSGSPYHLSSCKNSRTDELSKLYTGARNRSSLKEPLHAFAADVVINPSLHSPQGYSPATSHPRESAKETKDSSSGWFASKGAASRTDDLKCERADWRIKQLPFSIAALQS
ncbi:hypothetical protein T265_03967 [Opisthorchis viverrini]|uniref:C2H2-type domain-containing protein n=1 Tax=Opisthorchis viverrini TaxID=6198 RepID=A0A074ZU80_OPIVI|nr:hypothetical protein T265_03967 [Opisthorchis viverrini]KER29397.1 hypothetical protein T265_03967 [Opisthorchis viverrini]